MDQIAIFPNHQTLPRYSETTVPSAGWYWFIPTAGLEHEYERFVRLEEDALDGPLHCKKYQGHYIGPINPPKLQKMSGFITINTKVLSKEASQLMVEAMQLFRQKMEEEGLGDDEHGHTMSALYIRNITEAEKALVAPLGDTPSAIKPLPTSEPAICINGHQLPTAVAASVRCALSGDSLNRFNPAANEILKAIFED